MKYLIRSAPAFVLFLLPAAASAQVSVSIGIGTGSTACTASNLCQVANSILFIINYVLVPVIFAFAFFIFIWGVFKTYLWSRGDEAEVQKGHLLVWWGIIGFVIMISLWGLVNAVSNTFGLSGAGAPPTPTSYSTTAI